ncbi:MAG: hypothetical protein LBT53_09755 [Puniceicoccales bacterium]|jgi:hypothetical protein|nr:hypothetical protein [Puniceicoccales bacterium]
MKKITAPFALPAVSAGIFTALALICANGTPAAAADKPAAKPAVAPAKTLERSAAFFAKVAGRAPTAAELASPENLFNALEKSDELLADWLRQDLNDPMGRTVFADDKVFENLRRAAAKAAADLEKLSGEKAPAPPATPLSPPPSALSDAFVSTAIGDYRSLCLRRRAARLATAAKQTPRLVYARHFVMGASHYAYTEALSDAQAERSFVPGAKLCFAEFAPDGLWRETVLLDSKEGVIRDVDADFDAKRILFSWKKSDRADDYHLYEIPIGTDGRPQPEKIRQLTTGLGVADYEGCYLADGSILFNSSRCQQIVDCWWTEVSNLYRCDADGANIYRLTFDQVHDNYPTLTWDNRILYTRWEYNDRSQMYPQPLFQMNTDGTSQTAVYGENSWFPTTIIHARAIPDTQDMFAIATGHHSRQPGELILIQPGKGRQETEGITRVAPVRPHVKKDPVIIDAYGQGGPLFAYPWPLDSRQLLVTHNPAGWRQRDLRKSFGLYWADIDGNRELLVPRLDIAVGRVVPLVPRKRPAARASTVDYARDDGTFHILDVYEGEAMKGVPRGTVKTLRVVELDFRAAGIHSNGNNGPGGGAMVSTPIAIGNGSWDVKAVLGDAKVWPDGSVFFKAPSRRTLYFILLDEKGRMVQTMRSWTILQPGENASCVGCHEQKNAAPPVIIRPKQALVAGAQKLVPLAGTPTLAVAPAKDRRGMSFPKDIQPILNKHCISCHVGEKPAAPAPAALAAKSGAPAAKPSAKPAGKPVAAPPDFRDTPVRDGGAGRAWTRSYLSLTHARGGNGLDRHPVVNWVSAASAPPIQKPWSAGSNTSALFKKLDAGHCKTISPREVALLAAWVDLGVPFCGDYTEANIWSPKDKAKHDFYQAKRDALTVADLAVLAKLRKKSTAND